MAAADLLQLFESLVLPMATPSRNDLSAVAIPESGGHRLAKDANGYPCLLIRQSPQRGRLAPIRLENLLVSFDVPCTISHVGRKLEQDIFTIVRCTASNPALFPHFLIILTPMICTLGPAPTHAAVRRAIAGLVELFQALSAPAKKTVQGLWAELFLIRWASDPRAMAAAWHPDPQEHFDFSAGPQRIEVKSSSLRRRVHHFSLVQLTPPQGTRVLVASLFVERSGGGASVHSLFDSVRALLASSAELMRHFDATFYASLGAGWEEAMNEAFDWEMARESLAFFDADQIPTVPNPIPPSVSDVRFCSDLSAAVPLRRDEVIAAGGIFSAGIPNVGHNSSQY
ncbi:MAG: PD-(D/E)XK motif protein [Betaproteobacteria bacterium]